MIWWNPKFQKNVFYKTTTPPSRWFYAFEMRLFDLHFLDFKSIFKQTKNRKPEPAVERTI